MYSFTIGLFLSSPDLREEVQAKLHNLPVRVAFEMAPADHTAPLIEKLERSRPEIVLLESTAIEEQLGRVLFEMKHTAAAPEIIVLSKSSEPQKILAAIRAGASEYLYPPLGDTLQDALERMSPEQRQRRSGEVKTEGRTLGFLSAKGGCGATTLACHAAVEVQQVTGAQTMLADLDLGSGLIRFLMQCKTRYSVVDAMRNVQRLDRAYWSGLVSNGRPGLEIMAGPGEENTRELPEPHEIQHVLRFARQNYSWIVADLGHGLEPSTWSAIDEIDEVVLVSTLEVPALHRAMAISRQLFDSGFSRDRLRFVVNRVPRKNSIGAEELQRATGLPVYATIPNDFAAIETAYSEGRLLSGDHPVRQHIRHLAAKLTGAAQATPRRKFGIFR
jgi:pilus assembly protein CpaE